MSEAIAITGIVVSVVALGVLVWTMLRLRLDVRDYRAAVEQLQRALADRRSPDLDYDDER